ncbi:MAG: tripartite tricarboxylate transporter permease [Thermoplasmata archaeon]
MEPILLLLAVILFSLLGTAAGVATGLTPGLHVNTVAAMVLAFQGALLAMATAIFAWASPSPNDLLLIVAALVIGNVISHTFLDYIPSIFLGAPEAETALSVLPGHRMLLRGRGLEAIRLSAKGSMSAVLLSLLLILPFRFVMGPPIDLYENIRPFFHLLLILVASIFIISETPRVVQEEVELVCEMPQGLLKAGEAVPKLQELGPSEALDQKEAFLLRGPVLAHEGDHVEVGDQDGSVVVVLRGTPEEPLEGEVALFVAPERRVRKSGGVTQKGWALLAFLLSGFLGYLVLMSPLLMRNWYPLEALRGDPSTAIFLPLFTGLFGLPTLLISLFRTPRIPPQDLDPKATGLDSRAKTRATLGGSLAGAFVAWIPGVTAATATVLSQLFSGRERKGEKSDEEFILSLSCVNTSTAIFTIVVLFTILRARSGGMVAVQAIVGPLIIEWGALASLPSALILFLIAAIVAAGAAFYLTLVLGGLFARISNRIPYRKLVTAILIFLPTIILLLSGLTGLAVAAVATLIGLIPPLVGVRRVHLMGSLILPLIFLIA